MKIDRKRLERVRKALDALFANIESTKEETIATLGEKDAVHIVDFHANNWIDIESWIVERYKEECKNSVIFFNFMWLFKEIFWLGYLFLHANYPAVYRDLRYIWETFSKSYMVDKEHPTWSFDERIGEMWRLESERIFGWKLVKPVFEDVFVMPKHRIWEKFHPLWDYLNIHVHPSVLSLEEFLSADPAAHVTDSFNEQLARDCVSRVDEVMDVVFALIFQTFPKITEQALKYRFLNEWKKLIPYTHRIVLDLSRPEASPR